MIVRPARDSDLPALVVLVNSAYRGEESRKGWCTEDGLLGGQRVDLAMLREEIAEGRDCTVLTIRERDDAAIQGCVKLEMTSDVCELGMLSVAPDIQASGIGRRLLEASEDFARTRGARALRITVIHLRDSLIAWYERRGFRRTGETKPFPYGDARFGEPRRDDLSFVVLEKPL